MTKLLTILFLFFINYSICAQVTIGGSEKPAEGALLQLKNLPNVTTDIANANRGLLLPRVALTSETDLYPMFEKDGTYYSSNKITEDKAHIGLVVYNLADLRISIKIPETDCGNAIEYKEDGVTVGMAAWNGSKWYNLSENTETGQDQNTIYDNVFVMNDHEGNSYTYSKFGDAGYWMTSSLISKTPPPSIQSSLTYYLWDKPKTIEQNNTTAFYGYPRKALNQSIISSVDFLDNKSVGLLYSIGAVTGGKEVKDGMQGICPDGWHIPSADEYSALYSEIMNHKETYTTAKNNSSITVSQAITTKCTLFGPASGAVSKPAVKGGFSFIMSAWASAGTGEVANNSVFEFACTQNNKIAYQAGTFSGLNDNMTTGSWAILQMITLRCKKD